MGIDHEQACSGNIRNPVLGYIDGITYRAVV